MSFDPTDTYSFLTPCLNWKFILAYKGHSGWNGFTAPFQNKYLNRHEKKTNKEFLNGALIGQEVTEQEFDVDQLTGNVDFQSSLFGVSAFPFANPPAAGDPAWVIADDHYIHTDTGPLNPDGSQIVAVTEVTLSNQYTIAQLDADTDALIDAVDPDSLPWGTVTPVWYPDTENSSDLFGGIATAQAASVLDFFIPGIPPSVGVLPSRIAPPSVFAQSPAPFTSAAGYAYAPNPNGTDPAWDVPAGYAKWVGFVRMAGKFCRRTFLVDYNVQPVGQPRCVSGKGGCATAFEVRPPALVLGMNAYVIVTPNCQCQ